jgi:hypothetical protein
VLLHKAVLLCSRDGSTAGPRWIPPQQGPSRMPDPRGHRRRAVPGTTPRWRS